MMNDREVTHEHRLALDLTSGVVGELRSHEQRGTVGKVLLLALFDRGLHLVEARCRERQRHSAGEVFDGTDFIEDLSQPAARVRVVRPPGCPGLVTNQPVERLGLNGKKVGYLKVFGDPSE